MISQDKFNLIKEKYCYWGSWAVWSEVADTPKSNIGDLGIFDIPETLNFLNPNLILVGLNISRGAIKYPFANFHDSRTEATDFKIRYALKNTSLWGAYMTDIIKDFDQKESGKVATYLRANKQFEMENVAIFRQELKDLEANNPTLVAFGNDAYSILNKNFRDEYRVLKIPHYANYSSKEKYREEVTEIIKCI